MKVRILCALILVSGCRAPETAVTRAAEIVDAIHSDGHQGFYFLPPLAPATELPPSFDDSLSLLAELEDASGAVVTAAALAVTDEHYHGFIDSDGLALDPARLYRLRVR